MFYFLILYTHISEIQKQYTVNNVFKYIFFDQLIYYFKSKRNTTVDILFIVQLM